MEIYEFAIRIGCAIGAGLLIGIEREYKKKSAGLKTNMLVSLGAAVFILLSLRFMGEEHVDITRVLSQVVIGVGFLGAGTIMQRGKDIYGLTTAATIWCSAAAGCMAGFGLFWELGILTAVVVLINYVFGIIDSKIGKDKNDDS
ncbi:MULTISPECIES: MgtC/SapB family protein [Altibacter]|uniref:MgtC/SapB family protein n=1 Tax=Altibacter TaxID=1535231 RepID=UPI00054DB778|nr:MULTISPECIES: MgtC/SapB family protein [Altibacter]MCW8981976.1 MgtC/SapB family protein [Altibacter sp.]MCW9038121.1 MgtC/SapB family protein [Altibacter sp.]